MEAVERHSGSDMDVKQKVSEDLLRDCYHIRHQNVRHCAYLDLDSAGVVIGRERHIQKVLDNLKVGHIVMMALLDGYHRYLGVESLRRVVVEHLKACRKLTVSFAIHHKAAVGG